MSVDFEFKLRIRGYAPGRLDRIARACMELWPFPDVDFSGGCRGDGCEILTRAVGSFCAGDDTHDPFDFTDLLARAVWKANGGYCEVTVWSDCLEPDFLEIPTCKHEYEQWRASNDFKDDVGTRAEVPGRVPGPDASGLARDAANATKRTIIT